MASDKHLLHATPVVVYLGIIITSCSPLKESEPTSCPESIIIDYVEISQEENSLFNIPEEIPEETRDEMTLEITTEWNAGSEIEHDSIQIVQEQGLGRIETYVLLDALNSDDGMKCAETTRMVFELGTSGEIIPEVVRWYGEQEKSIEWRLTQKQYSIELWNEWWLRIEARIGVAN